MSNSGKPGSGAFPFMPFPIPGFTAAGGEPTMSATMAGGADLLKTLWGNLPGSSQVPGFLMPTLDVEELDKRITDLRAAESWVEVNLNMLRATIQGLEVQRHTIAALKSMSAAPSPIAPSPSDPFAQPHKPAVEAGTPAAPGLVAGSWLAFMQDQFTKVAGAALSAGPAAKAEGRGVPTKSPTKARPRRSKRSVAKP